MSVPAFRRDHVLTDLAATRIERDHADRVIRDLVAYARTFIHPRPYRLADLAAAAGMSTSGVRTCFTAEHINRVSALIKAPASGSS
ncbi:hypothetical protein KZ829_23495 [Actinoplanes hulinensis]|uniref:Uncharacterized protein n=1 Tax=Actinoplanes hulinensis TaxID=1144547 RepID=A0ABS7B6N1_9ACTN|nr:hypothetical protein [Actinoplanes hulinensis]MBW6436711.1 hypothetical protein [Actinoplanes hulinensis]